MLVSTKDINHLQRASLFILVKYKILQRPAILMLTCLLSPLNVHTAQLEPYTDEAIKSFTLTDINQETHSLTDYRGKVILVNFWASWCLPCIQEMPGMRRLADSLNDQDFKLLTLNTTDSARRIQEVLKRLKLDMTVLLDHDGDTFETWQGQVLPTSYLLDHNGRIRYRVIGPMEWDDADVLLKVKQLIQSR
jgi:peroxiredoxin